MHPFPHHYHATVSSLSSDSGATIASPGLVTTSVGAPAEFGGTGTDWSPETLLVGAVGSCFILGFRMIATASKLEWTDVRCAVDGKLERDAAGMRFTEITIQATLVVPDEHNSSRAERILQKAKESCLVTNSLSATVHFSQVTQIG